VTLGVGAGLVVVGCLTALAVVGLQREAMEQALVAEERRVERHVAAMVVQLALEEFTGDGGSLGRFGARLTAAAESVPNILDLVVVDPERRVVRHFSRHGREHVPCVAAMPLAASMDGEHAAGEVAPSPVACKSLPVIVDGQAVGAVLFHAERDAGAEAAGWVRRTALRLLPVFLGSYLLLGVLLIAASRALKRWRERAAAAERVEALGALADGINHDIKNPLNSVGLSLQFVARKHLDPETREVVDAAGREAERIRERLEEFARFTRASRLATERVALGERLRSRFGQAEARIAIEGDAVARVDAPKVDDAVGAIVEFLLRHGEGDGNLRMVLSATRSQWRLVAEGPSGALDAGDLGRLFDPYVRAGSHDVGRGLALARAVFQAHGGDLVARLKGSRLVLCASAPKIPPGEKR
jgi:signal transduction histidine kinase